MVTRTPQQIITGACQTLQVVAAGELPTPGELADAFLRLTDLIESWQLSPQMMLVQDRHEFTLLANQQTWLIGTDGTEDWTLERPVRVEGVGYILPGSSPATEKALQSFTDLEWAAVRVKPLVSLLPTSYYYNPTLSQTSACGSLLFWPVPSQDLAIEVYTLTPVAAMTSLTQTYVLPPGYARALRLNLALEIAPDFGVTASPLIMKQASDALSDVKRANLTMVDLTLDSALTGARGAYDIFTDQ